MLLKDFYNADFAAKLAAMIKKVYPSFDEKGFTEYLSEELGDKSYSEKMAVFTHAFDQFLPEYLDTLSVFQGILGNELSSFAVMYSDGAYLAPVGKYVETHAAEREEYFLPSAAFIYELTKRYTGEFAMRPLIRVNPERAMAKLSEWSLDKSAYVRRLSSECMRPNLPWAKRLTEAVSRFEDYSHILDNLKNDPDPYVQRSVANNLNDLYKYDPEKADIIVRRWSDGTPSPATLRIIRHGTRSLRKKKRSDALK